MSTESNDSGAPIRLEVERNERLTCYIPDTLLHKAGHFAGIHPEMLALDGGMRSWCDLIGDTIELPSDGIGNHLNRLGEADMPQRSVLDTPLELLRREPCRSCAGMAAARASCMRCTSIRSTRSQTAVNAIGSASMTNPGFTPVPRTVTFARRAAWSRRLTRRAFRRTAYAACSVVVTIGTRLPAPSNCGNAV